LGKGYLIKDGNDITVISSGPMVHNVLEAVRMLNNELSVRVVNLPTLKPVDKEIILASIAKTDAILTVEDHTIEGGLGSIVCEVLAEKCATTPVWRHGILDVFTESGTPKELEEKYGLDPASLVKKIRECFILAKQK
jgi:transketolase